MDIFRYFEWTFTPQTRELQGRDLHTTRFRLSPTFYFSTLYLFICRIFVGFLNPSNVILIRIWRSSTPSLAPPLLRKKSIEIWGRSLGSFLAKNHPNRRFVHLLLATSTSRIAEGASRGGREPPPGRRYAWAILRSHN